MPFPFPLDPDYRKIWVGYWLDDVDDMLETNRVEDAVYSWKVANSVYLSLPPGCGDMSLEDRLTSQRVKLANLSQPTNENHF